jgi:ADP-heptose:LPS heptosyltransferase
VSTSVTPRLVPLQEFPGQSKPVLVVFELHLLGDLVLSLPFFKSASSTFDTHLICRPSTAALLQDYLSADRIHPWNPPWEPDAGHARGRIGELVRTLRGLRPAVVLCSWPDARVGWLMRLSGARQRVGFPMLPRNYHAMHIPWRVRNQRLGRLLELLCPVGLYTHPLLRESPSQHRIKDWEQVARAIGLSFEPATPWWRVEPAPPSPPSGLGESILAIAPHARLDCKTWPVEYFAQTATHLLQNGSVREVRVLLPPGVTFRPKLWPASTRLITTPSFAHLAFAICECSVLLANDSFAGHLAASLGVPVVTIFGSGSPDWFRPWGIRNLALRGGDCPYHPCIERCMMPSFVCLEHLSPESVALAVCRLLDKTAGASEQ